MGAVPVGIGLGDARHHPHDAFHDVVDVREIAAHPTFVEDVDGVSGEDGSGEQVEGHVRAAPRPVDGEETQARGGKPVEMAVGVGHEFVGLFGGGVEAHGMVYVVAHREGHGCVHPVDRA